VTTTTEYISLDEILINYYIDKMNELINLNFNFFD
jgi:hypothetical protein